MPLNLKDLALGRQLAAFVAEETSYGVLAPFVATDALAVTGLPKAAAPLSFSNSREKRDSRSLPGRSRDRTPAGTFSLACYASAPGTPGAPPAEDVLWKGLFGQKTVTPGSKVEYAPAMELPSFSLAFRVSHSCFFATGCAVRRLSLELGNKDFLELQAEGPCRQVLEAGSATTAAGCTTSLLKLGAGEAELFSPGARVRVGAEHNEGQGYLVQAVDEAAGTIEVSPALAEAPAAGVAVGGYLPEPTYQGQALENRLQMVSLDGTPLSVNGGRVAFEQEIKTFDDLIDGDDHCAGFVPGLRTITAELTALFLRPYLAFFRRARTQRRMAFELKLDGGAGRSFSFRLPRAEASLPELAEDVSVQAPFTLTAMADQGEDEALVTYA